MQDRGDLETLRELLLRVSRLAGDLPEVDLSPVIARPHGVFAMDARIKVVRCPPQDPFFVVCGEPAAAVYRLVRSEVKDFGPGGS